MKRDPETIDLLRGRPDGPAPRTESAPFAVTSATSRAAAKAVRSRQPSQRDRIDAALLGAGVNGLTRKEIAVTLGLSGDTVRPRLLELMQQGRARESTRVRDGCAVVLAWGVVDE